MPVTMPCTQPASMTPWLGYDFGPQQPTPVLPPPPHTLGNEGDILMNFDQEFASMLSPPRAKIFGPNHCLTEFPYRCNCSSFSGPCEFHREELKAQFAFPMAPGQPLGSMGPPFMDVPPIPEMTKVETSPPQSRTSPIISRPGSEARSSLQSSRTSSSTDTKHSSISTNSSGTNISKTAGSTRIRKRRASKANSTRSKASPAPEDVSTQTGKFKHILESIQDVGFEDFDSMVSQYYTCHFEKNSTVDVAQKTSRGRRLRQVLTSLQESSSDWTLWEARGYRDKIVEGAEGIYVDELKRLAKRRRNSVSGGRAGSSDSNMEESLSDAGSSSSNASAAGKSQPREPELQTPTGDVLRVYQNKVCCPISIKTHQRILWLTPRLQLPNLWALLTELAGTQGPHCERAALAAALVLYNARQNPDLDCKQLISKSFKDSDLLPVGSGA